MQPRSFAIADVSVISYASADLLCTSTQVFVTHRDCPLLNPESTRDIATASDRAAKVVFALKTYASYEQSKLIRR